MTEEFNENNTKSRNWTSTNVLTIVFIGIAIALFYIVVDEVKTVGKLEGSIHSLNATLTNMTQKFDGQIQFDRQIIDWSDRVESHLSQLDNKTNQLIAKSHG